MAIRCRPEPMLLHTLRQRVCSTLSASPLEKVSVQPLTRHERHTLENGEFAMTWIADYVESLCSSISTTVQISVESDPFRLKLSPESEVRSSFA